MTIYLLRDVPSLGTGTPRSTTHRCSEEEVELTARDLFASDDDDDEAGEEEDDNDLVVEELGGGIYLRYGDLVFLRGVDDGFMTNASGFAVLQDRSPRRIILEPTDGRPRQRRKGSDDRTSSSSSSLSSGRGRRRLGRAGRDDKRRRRGGMRRQDGERDEDGTDVIRQRERERDGLG